MSVNESVDIEIGNEEKKYFQANFIKKLDGIYKGNNDSLKNISNEVAEEIDNFESLDNFKRQFSINFLKRIISMVKDDLIEHRDFVIDDLKKIAFFKPLTKTLLIKRIEELKRSKVLKKGRKYYIKELKSSFLGGMITDHLDFNRRTVLNESEYKKLTQAIKKLNYEIPIVVEPTTTEKYFE